MKLYFATSNAKAKNKSLNDRGVQRRLLSYFYIKDLPQDFVQEYVATGNYVPKKRKRPRRRPPPKE